MSMKSGQKDSAEGTDDFNRIVLVKEKELKLDWAAFTKTKHKQEWDWQQEEEERILPRTNKKARIER